MYDLIVWSGSRPFLVRRFRSGLDGVKAGNEMLAKHNTSHHFPDDLVLYGYCQGLRPVAVWCGGRWVAQRYHDAVLSWHKSTIPAYRA